MNRAENLMRMEFKACLEAGTVRARQLQPFSRCTALRGVHLRRRAGIPDLFLLGKHGQLGLVEAKLGANREFGAPVVRQLLAYYVHAISRDWSKIQPCIEAARPKPYNRESPLISERNIPRYRRRHDRRKYHLFLLVDGSGWDGRFGNRLKDAGKWAADFLKQSRLMPQGAGAWFVVRRPGPTYELHSF